jgi:hypothetical protein
MLVLLRTSYSWCGDWYQFLSVMVYQHTSARSDQVVIIMCVWVCMHACYGVHTYVKYNFFFPCTDLSNICIYDLFCASNYWLWTYYSVTCVCVCVCVCVGGGGGTHFNACEYVLAHWADSQEHLYYDKQINFSYNKVTLWLRSVLCTKYILLYYVLCTYYCTMYRPLCYYNRLT